MEPLIAPVLDFVCPSSWFQSQSGSLACTLSCLRAVILKAVILKVVLDKFNVRDGEFILSFVWKDLTH